MTCKCVRVNVRARLAPISPHRRAKFILLCGRYPARCGHRVGVDARCTHLIRRIFIWMELHREPIMSCDVVIITCVMRQSSSSCPASERVMQRRNTHTGRTGASTCDWWFALPHLWYAFRISAALASFRTPRLAYRSVLAPSIFLFPASPPTTISRTPAGVHASSPSRLFFRPAPSDFRRRRDEKCGRQKTRRVKAQTNSNLHFRQHP